MGALNHPGTYGATPKSPAAHKGRGRGQEEEGVAQWPGLGGRSFSL